MTDRVIFSFPGATMAVDLAQLHPESIIKFGQGFGMAGLTKSTILVQTVPRSEVKGKTPVLEFSAVSVPLSHLQKGKGAVRADLTPVRPGLAHSTFPRAFSRGRMTGPRMATTTLPSYNRTWIRGKQMAQGPKKQFRPPAPRRRNPIDKAVVTDLKRPVTNNLSTRGRGKAIPAPANTKVIPPITVSSRLATVFPKPMTPPPKPVSTPTRLATIQEHSTITTTQSETTLATLVSTPAQVAIIPVPPVVIPVEPLADSIEQPPSPAESLPTEEETAEQLLTEIIEANREAEKFDEEKRLDDVLAGIYSPTLLNYQIPSTPAKEVALGDPAEESKGSPFDIDQDDLFSPLDQEMDDTLTPSDIDQYDLLPDMPEEVATVYMVDTRSTTRGEQPGEPRILVTRDEGPVEVEVAQALSPQDEHLISMEKKIQELLKNVSTL